MFLYLLQADIPLQASQKLVDAGILGAIVVILFALLFFLFKIGGRVINRFFDELRNQTQIEAKQSDSVQREFNEYLKTMNGELIGILKRTQESLDRNSIMFERNTVVYEQLMKHFKET